MSSTPDSVYAPRVSYLEKHIQKITIWTVIIGSLLAFVLPWAMSKFRIYGLTHPNEIGDTFNGMASPIISIIGILLTFLAFYVQYKANERQVDELEKQKRNAEYKYLQEEIGELKDEIRHLSYTRDDMRFTFSEAIWHYMYDCLKDKDNDEAIVRPMYYQLTYVISLFEPILQEIENSILSDRDKVLSINNLYGLFEASIDLVIIIYENHEKETGDALLKNTLKSNVAIPAKRTRLILSEKLSKYQKSEKEIFIDALKKIKGCDFIKNRKILHGRASISYFTNYDEYIAADKNSDNIAPMERFRKFSADYSIKKMLVSEPVKLMMRHPFISVIEISVSSDKNNYCLLIERDVVEEYCQLDLGELNIDKELWRDRFQGKFIYDRKELAKFIEHFSSKTSIM